MPTSAMDIYNSALQQQQGLFNQISSGYNKLRNDLVAGQTQVVQGYNNLSSQVQGTIGDIGRAQSQRIADQYTNLSGTSAQALTNRGLGNTTVASAVNRGISLDKAKADVELQNQIAQTQAQYLSSIGLAGLGYQGAAYQQQMDLGNAGLNAQRSFSPVYASLQEGMAGEARYQQQRQDQIQQSTMDRIYGSAMGASAQTSQNAARSSAMTQQQGQFDAKQGLEYAQLGQQGNIAGNQLGFQYAQLGQQNQQFGQALDRDYDFKTGAYGRGAPSSYAGVYGPAPASGGGSAAAPANMPYQYPTTQTYGAVSGGLPMGTKNYA